MKEIKEEINKWKNIHVHGLNGLISLKCPYYRFNVILTETLMTFSVFAEIAETILKFIWKHEDLLLMEKILRIHNGGKVVSSSNGIGITGHPYIKE